jgi:hypothetical protein
MRVKHKNGVEIVPITNPEEMDTLSPLGEGLAFDIHRLIKENVTIGSDVCESHPSDHEGLYLDDGSCFDCSFKAEFGVVPWLALQTFLEPRISPWNYTNFIGKFDHEDWGNEVLFGKACAQCGTNLRYEQAKMCVCVFCSGMKIARKEGGDAMIRWSKQAEHPLPPSSHWDRFLRDTALAEGVATYNAGKPCEKHGPKIERYTTTGRCVECVKGHNVNYHKKAAADVPAAAPKDTNFDSLFD